MIIIHRQKYKKVKSYVKSPTRFIFHLHFLTNPFDFATHMPTNFHLFFAIGHMALRHITHLAWLKVLFIREKVLLCAT